MARKFFERMRFCRYELCENELSREQKSFCSRACRGFAVRGSGKHHIRMRLESGMRVYLHRYIFEQNHRALEPGEVVHHIDGNKFNNEPENLQALSYAEHLAAHNYWRGHRRMKAQNEAELTEMAEMGW